MLSKEYKEQIENMTENMTYPKYNGIGMTPDTIDSMIRIERSSI